MLKKLIDFSLLSNSKGTKTREAVGFSMGAREVAKIMQY